MRHAMSCLILCLVSTACAGDSPVPLPQREDGLWEVSVTAVGVRRARPVVTRECTSAEVDAHLLLSQAPGQEHCDAPEVTATGSGWQVRTRCRVHGSDVETVFAFEGDFRTAYAGRFDSRNAAACEHRPSDCRQQGSITARRLGECTDTLQPGYRQLPNGIVVHPSGT